MTGPSPRYEHAMVYDGARGVAMLFGGSDNYSYQGDTWEWDGTTWTLRSTTGPSPRDGHVMAYDDARAVMVLFGGIGGTTYFNDTWELPSCPVDSDGDGVPDRDDTCPNSDLGETVVIDGCDSGVANHLFDDGCTMSDLIGQCAEEARNHGAFVSCVAGLTSTWVRDDIITPRDKGSIQRCAAHANLPEQTEGRPRKPKGISVSPLEALSKP